MWVLPCPALFRWSLALVVSLAAAGCAGKRSAGAKEGEPGGVEGAEAAAATMKAATQVEPMVPLRKVALIPLRVDSQHCDAAGKRVLQQDLNQDGRADLVTLTLGGDQDGKIRCQQADLDRDGRLDAFLHYDERGDLVREQYDQDYDGRIDLGRTYKDGKIELDEQDLDHDGYVDAWRRYDKGKLVRIDHDRDRDGRADTFTFFVRGQIDRVGYDTNGDGNVDNWDQDVARRAQAALARRMQARVAVGDEFVEAPSAEPPPEEAAKGKDGKAPEDPKGKGKTGGKVAKGEPQADGKAKAKAGAKPDANGGDAAKGGKPEAKGEATPDAKAGAKPDAKGGDAAKGAKPEAKGEAKPDPAPRP